VVNSRKAIFAGGLLKSKRLTQSSRDNGESARGLIVSEKDRLGSDHLTVERLSLSFLSISFLSSSPRIEDQTDQFDAFDELSKVSFVALLSQTNEIYAT